MEISMSTAFLFFTVLSIMLIAIGVYNAARINEINSRTFKVEHVLNSMATSMKLGQMERDFNEMMSEHSKSSKSGSPKAIFRTADGKHVAGSLQELFEKMTNDPQSPIDKNELEALKKIFEQISSEIEDDDDDEE